MWGLLEVVLDLRCCIQSFLVFLIVGSCLEEIDLGGDDLTSSWVIDRNRVGFRGILGGTFDTALYLTVSRRQLRRIDHIHFSRIK